MAQPCEQFLDFVIHFALTYTGHDTPIRQNFLKKYRTDTLFQQMDFSAVDSYLSLRLRKKEISHATEHSHTCRFR